jgi:hypothetical protein
MTLGYALLNCGGPPDITSLIMAIVINSIHTVRWRGSRPKSFHKRQKIREPELNPPPTVTLPPSILRVHTTIFGTVINEIFRKLLFSHKGRYTVLRETNLLLCIRRYIRQLIVDAHHVEAILAATLPKLGSVALAARLELTA